MGGEWGSLFFLFLFLRRLGFFGCAGVRLMLMLMMLFVGMKIGRAKSCCEGRGGGFPYERMLRAGKGCYGFAWLVDDEHCVRALRCVDVYYACGKDFKGI